MNEPERERIRLCGPKDFDVSYFCGSGAGGQARNKVHSGVQLIHRESGAIGRASDSRSQHDNKRSALERLVKTPRFQFWLSARLYELEQGEKLEETIERETRPECLRYEIKNATGQWEEVNEAYFNGPAAREES
jgi:protein subunit release factor A